MVKIIELLPLLFLAFPVFNEPTRPSDAYKSFIITGSSDVKENGCHTFEHLTGFTGSEFRIYRYDDYLIDEISDEAFKDSDTVTTLVVSDCVNKITNDLFKSENSHIQNIQYTGSKEDFATKFSTLNDDIKNKVVEYATDEGFMNYWNEFIRPDKDFNICSISEDVYRKAYGLYTRLSAEDLAYVKELPDNSGAKIKDSMDTLKRYFVEGNNAQKNEEWNQTGAITLIIVISIIGMTSITVFFLLKTKNIIQ